jgi:hypothetical protein
MPLTGDDKRAYQREYMRKKRLGLTGLTTSEAGSATLNQQVHGSIPWWLTTSNSEGEPLIHQSLVPYLSRVWG